MAETRERPILFSAPMVRALLAGTKTQTRRAVEPQPFRDASTHGYQWHGGTALLRAGYGDRYVHTTLEPMQRAAAQCCPYGSPGDRLWVRETYQADPPIDSTWHSTAWHGCPEHAQLSEIPERYRLPKHCIYRADWTGAALARWRPAIQMPRWASRITLEITGVRVERLQDISEADAMAEGIEPAPGPEPYPMWRVYGAADTRVNLPESSYRSLWESINGRGSWDANPLVWVVEFRRIEGQP